MTVNGKSDGCLFVWYPFLETTTTPAIHPPGAATSRATTNQRPDARVFQMHVGGGFVDPPVQGSNRQNLRVLSFWPTGSPDGPESQTEPQRQEQWRFPTEWTMQVSCPCGVFVDKLLFSGNK